MTELDRLIRETAREADASRRTWASAVCLTAALTAFAFTPFLPRTNHIFGVVSVRQAVTYVMPSALFPYAVNLVYRRCGAESRAYRVAEAVEALILNGVVIAFIAASHLSYSVMWALIPLSAIAWAQSRPFLSRLPAAILIASDISLALALALRGDRQGAAVGVVATLGALLGYVAAAKNGRRSLTLEAARNVARAELSSLLLTRERGRMARASYRDACIEIASLGDELDAGIAQSARAALAEIERTVRPSGYAEV